MSNLNALIAQGYQFKPIADPFEQYGKMQQLEQGRQTNELNALKLDEARRGVAEQNQLRQLDPAAADYIAQVTRINPRTGFEFGKLQRDADTARLTQQKTQIETAAARKKLEAQALRDLSQNPSDAQVIAHFEDMVNSGLYSQAEQQQTVAELQQFLAIPFEQRKSLFASQGATAGELKPTLTTQNLGDSTQQLSTPAFGGAATVVPGSKQQINITPGQAQANRLSEARLAQGERRLDQADRRIDAAITNSTTAASGLTPKEIARRESKYPAASSAVKEAVAAQDKLIKDLQKLKEHPGLEGITGVVFGRTPSLAGASREAKALLDKILARGGFSELAKMRAASPTGGALGNISDTEGKYLRSAFGALDPTQTRESFIKGIEDVIAELQGSKSRIQEAFDTTYEYKGTSTPAAPESGLTPAEQAELEQLRKRFKK